jgi:tetratricopeptide (TPR) repeat protein
MTPDPITSRPRIFTPLCALLLAALMLIGTTLAPRPAAGQDRPHAQQNSESTRPVSAEEQRAVIDQIAKLLQERYVFEDKGREAADHIHSLQASGAFKDGLDPDDFATELTQALQSITHDKHMRVRAMRPGQGMPSLRPGGAPEQSPAQRFLNVTPPVRDGNWGFKKLESRPGNIGYLKLNGFAGDPAALPTAAAAMNFLAGSDALIIDLRENGGGSPEMIRYISSYLFDQPTHLNSLYWRDGDRTQEFWTRTDVPGNRLGQDVPLFVLTSNRTFSGGEEFAYNIQTQQRGVLIGETTGGGANPGGGFSAGERFLIFIPTGRAVNPITRTNWEGVGVKPEIETPAADAYDKALELARQASEERRDRRAAEVQALRQAVVDALESAAAQFEANADHRSDDLEVALERAISRGALGEMEVNVAGYGYLEARRLGEALALLRFNVERFPTSPNAHDSLGEALEKRGQLEEAVAEYRKACELGAAQQDERLSTFKANLQRASAALSQKSQ